ncbi:MAG: glycoside hydrolase family 127 protein [Gemmatimonadaceae bacterium]|nr:glycoside hydrolase family 127 protein [Gemmatimonadaceae bacterium]
MSNHDSGKDLTRRELLQRFTASVLVTVSATPIGQAFALTSHAEPEVTRLVNTEPVNAVAGVDRVVMKHGKTYLNGWAGYGTPPRPGRGRRGAAASAPTGPAPRTTWSKVSGPGTVTFADPNAASTTATFSAAGDYVLRVTANNGDTTAESTLTVKVELPPPVKQLSPVVTTRHTITSPLWSARTKILITKWIPHCIEQCTRTDIPAGRGDGGLDNFIEAAKALRGEPHAAHRGYVFSNAWVHQTVESMSLALMVDPQGDTEIVAAQNHMRTTLNEWIPIILAAQHPDGYLHTALTLRDVPRPDGPGIPGGSSQPWTQRWSASARANHEGYVAGYFIESAINHYSMTDRKDDRLYTAAKRLCDCWADHIGPAPKQEWFDGHQEMEQALVRFGRFVNEVEGGGKGDRYVALAKFLLDCRGNGSEYDQSHVPVTQQYEAVGHAVRAVYNYSAMADVAVETHDVDYQSAVKSLWDNITHKKYYLTGGVGSGETSEGFGPNYSLRNNAYCEACSSCGEIFFQWKLHLAYHDAKYADLFEQTLYNALLGALDLEGTAFFYTNPLAQTGPRSAWHGVPCCTGNIPRTLLMLPTWMYSKDTQAIHVNLFAGSRVLVDKVAGTDVEMVQDTNYPWSGNVAITVNPTVPARFSINIRMPTRDASALYAATPKADGISSLKVNGRAERMNVVNGYAVVTRRWSAGDTIELALPMTVQRVRADARIEADVGRVALRYGPLVYNIEKVDQDIDGVLAPDAPLTTEWRGDLLGGVTVITGAFANGAPMTAIPHYARFNRNPAPPPPPPRPDSATAAANAAANAIEVATAAATAIAAGKPLPRPAGPTASSIVWIRERPA